MSRMVTAIIAARRNRTVDYNAGEVFTFIKIAWSRSSWEHVCNSAYDHCNYMETRL